MMSHFVNVLEREVDDGDITQVHVSRFLDLVQRNISPEIFFDSLLSDEDLSKMLCTCKGMKDVIKKWKSILPIQKYTIKEAMTASMFGNMIMYYSNNIKKLNTSHPLTLFDDEYDDHIVLYHHLSYLSKNLCYLGFNGGNSSKVYLAPLLSCLVNLTHLDLHESLIVEYDQKKHCTLIMSLTTTRLNRLKIHESIIYRNGLSYLSSLLNLTHFELTNCEEVPMEEFYHLSFCVNLTYLDLSGSITSDRGLSHLSSLTKLSKLKITGLNKDEGLVFLSSLSSNLTYLKLRSCTLTEKGLCYLASCVNLTYLDLKRSLIPDGLLFLSSLSKLTYLNLQVRRIELSKNDLFYINSCCENLNYVTYYEYK
jgi:hypothetical protein